MSASRKLRKLLRSPGLYWRDYFLKRYPLPEGRLEDDEAGRSSSRLPRRPRFEAVRPLQAVDTGEVLTFGIPLASARSVADWSVTCGLLAATLRSIRRQSSDAWRVIIAGHEAPDIPELDHPQIEFLSLKSPRPSQPSKFRADKARKRHVLGLRLRQLGGGYFMQLDADDLINRSLVSRCLSEAHPHGYILTHGYAWDHKSDAIAPVPGAWPLELDRVCGSCAVVRYEPDDLPDERSQHNDPDLVFNMTRQHAYIRVVCEELGRPLMPLQVPMVTYVVNHGVSISFQMQKKISRGMNIVKSIHRNQVRGIDEKNRIIEQFGIDVGMLDIERTAAQ